MAEVEREMAARKARWTQFLERSGPPGHMLLVRYDEGLPPRPLPHPDRVAERIEWAWLKYRKQLEAASWLDDDAVPCLDPYTGTEIFAAAFGCRVHRPEDTNPFALPLIHDAGEVAGLRVPEISAEPLAVLFEIADELRRRAGPEGLMRLPDIQSPMDIAALIWDKNDFYIAALEAPEAVRELAAKVRQLLTAFLDEWFARYGRDFVAHYPDYYMPGGITLSEDEIGAVNPEMFRQLFLPELAELSSRYGCLGMHCCADAHQHWEAWKEIPALRLLNIVQKPPVVQEAYTYFAGHTTQMHSWCGDGEPAAWTFPEDSRVVVSAGGGPPDAARELVEKLRGPLGR
ncbi:MAG: uroporphyrinogen decarboxylase family protein [Gemmatimonadota bacterium]